MNEIEAFAAIKGSCTELVTLYIIANADIGSYVKMMNQELGFASQIKNKKNRNAVCLSIKQCI